MKSKMRVGIILYIVILFLIVYSQVPTMITKAAKLEDNIDISTSPSRIFNVSNMKPGDNIDSILTVENKGRIDFAYNIGSKLESGSEKLYEELQLTISDNKKELYTGSLGDFKGISERDLKTSSKEPLTFTVYLPYESGNEFQGLSMSVMFSFLAEGIQHSPVEQDHPLPQTSTNIFTSLLIGVVIFTFGYIFYVFLKRKYNWFEN